MKLNCVTHGYCPDALKALPDQSVNCCVTSPPYFGVRVYEGVKPQKWEDGTESCLGQEDDPDLFANHLVEIFREVRRVLRDDGTLWLNLGDSYAGGGRAGKNPEYMKKHKMFGKEGGDPGRFGLPQPVPKGLKHKDLIGVPWRVAFALQRDGWWLRSDIIWHKPAPTPEPVKDRPTRAHEYVFLLSKSKKYYYDSVAIQEPIEQINHTTRFGGNKYPNADGIKGTFSGREYDSSKLKGKNKRSVWKVTTEKTKEKHYAAFPPALITPMVLAGCPEGGIVLDPFAGTGTTIVTAMALDRKGIGFDASPMYANEISEARITQAKTGLTKKEQEMGQQFLFDVEE
jgi:site-specific DNA-methyltransferase (adenine-specific)